MTYIVSGGALNSTQTKSGAPPQTPWGYAPDASGELTALPQTSHLYLREPTSKERKTGGKGKGKKKGRRRGREGEGRGKIGK